MVHALEIAGDLVGPGGVVVVAHDKRTPPTIELHQGPSHSIAGWLHDNEGFPMIRLADQAVENMIESDQFRLIDQSVFVYRTCIDSRNGFREWLDAQWETSFLPDQIAALIEAFYIEGGDETTAIVQREAWIRSLRVL